MPDLETDLETGAHLIASMTAAPWMPEKSFSYANDPNVHWSIRTAEKMPDTPWSPRYVAWINGSLRDSHSINAIADSHYKFCDHCKRGYLDGREAGVEVRVDEQTEADVNGIVWLRNNAAPLIESATAHSECADRLRSHREIAYGVMSSLIEGMGLIAQAVGMGTAVELDEQVIECVQDLVKERDGLRRELAALGNAAVDSLLIGHVFMPRPTTEPLAPRDTPLSRDEIERLQSSVRIGTDVAESLLDDDLVPRLLATIEQRNRIYAAIQTDADPAGTIREVVELRDLVRQLSRHIEENASAAWPVGTAIRLQFDRGGVTVKRRVEHGGPLITEPVPLNAENQGSLVINVHDDESNPNEVGYVVVVQKWMKDWPAPAKADDDPIPLIIHCPKCHRQHIDVDDETGKWATERIHRRHLCKEADGGCGHIWAPSNRPTVGVRELPEVGA